MTNIARMSRGTTLALLAICWASSLAAKPNPFLSASDPAQKRTLSRAELRAPATLSDYAILLPNGQSLLFKRVSVTSNAGVKTIQAKSEVAQLLLTTDGQRAYGYVLTAGENYRIDTNEGETVIVNVDALPSPSQILGSAVDDAVINYQRSVQSLDSVNGQAIAQDGPYVIDIAFFYDGALAYSEGQQMPRTHAQAAVDYTNAAFATHSLDVQLRLVYVGELSVPLMGDPWTAFVTNEDRLGVGAQFGADVSHYIYNYQTWHGYCGKAYVPGRVGVSAAECGNSTIAHELGHNFGMNHDRPNAGFVAAPYNDYNFGYWCGGSATLMTYGSPKVPFYSSPLQSFGGEACGVAIGQPDAAHNAEVVNQTKAVTSNYRTPPAIHGEVRITTSGPILVTEGIDGQVVIEIERDGDLSVETSIEVGIVGNEASAGSDYADVVERVIFYSGESVKQFIFDINDDENYEPTAESMNVVIRYPDGLSVGAANSVTVSITSDDPDRGFASFPSWYGFFDENVGMALIDVRRIGTANLPLTANFRTYDDTAYARFDYVATSGQITFEAGETAATISIPIIDDDVFEGIDVRNFRVMLEGDNIDVDNNYFYAYIENDDLYRGQLRLSSDTYFMMENAGSVNVTIERLNGLEDSHPFWLHYSEGTAVHLVDFYANSIRASVAQGQSALTFGVSGIYDNVNVDGDRYFNLDLDPDWGSLNPIHARVYIIDDEAPTSGGGEINVEAASVEQDEGGGFVNVVIERTSGSTGAAMVNYSTSPISATQNGDYVYTVGTVGWVDGDASKKIVQVPIINDSYVEPDETFEFTIGNAGGAALGSAVTTTVTIADNDGPGVLSFALADNTLSEDGWVDVSVQRDFGTGGPVSVSYQTVERTAKGDIDFSSTLGTLEWTNGDASAKQIRLFGIGDDLFEFNESFQIQLFNPAGGAILGDQASSTVTIPANDLPEFVPVFDDVPNNHWAWLYIQILAGNEVTSGCGNGNYCADNVVTRAQMAVFLERGMNGSDFSPPAATGNIFDDVGAEDFAASFIEQLSADGITSGCGNNNYCPAAEVTRAQMAIFLLRAMHGSDYSPPQANGIFGDVPADHWAAGFIEQLKEEGITAGCDSDNFCPDASVTRAQMAVFLVRSFGLH